MPVSEVGQMMKSVIYQPLIIDKRIIGVIGIQSLNEHAYNNAYQKMIRTLASYSAIALDNANVYLQIEEKNEMLRKAINSLEEVTITDQLTGAYNRHYLDKFLNKDLAKLKREYFKPDDREMLNYGLIMIDADHFKQVNDVYGHDAGDKVLISRHFYSNLP